jgi:hypothetical protein
MIRSVLFLLLGFFLSSAYAQAQTQTQTQSPPPTNVKFVTTGTPGAQHLSDSPALGDPLGNRPVNSNWDAGPALTQKPYTDDCMEDRCIRAKKRQLGNTTWQQDRASGLSR